MTPEICAIEVRADYRLLVQFENGNRGELDMTPYLDFGVFRNLKDESLFGQATVAFGTVEWPGGIDLDPAFVYDKCQMEEVASA